MDWTVSISYGDDVQSAREAILTMFAADDRIMQAQISAAAKDISDNNDNESLPKEEVEADVAEADAPRRSVMDKLLGRRRIAKAALSRLDDRLKKRREEPAPDYSPKIFVGSLAASSVDLTVRAWTKSENYWGVYFYYNELFYNELPKHGINFPFPQLDVHLPVGAVSQEVK